jgi:hypothetical protein
VFGLVYGVFDVGVGGSRGQLPFEVFMYLTCHTFSPSHEANHSPFALTNLHVLVLALVWFSFVGQPCLPKQIKQKKNKK